MAGNNPVLGFIGLGVMGEPMCRNLIAKADKGSAIHLFDVNPEPVTRLVQCGGIQAESVSQLASKVDVLFLSLPGGAEVDEVLTTANGVFSSMRAGSIIVDLSTSEVSLTQRLAATAHSHGLQYADAPVARTREAAISGTLAIMVGADTMLFKTIQPYLACMASDILHCGDPGAGQMVKILNNMVLFQTVLALSEALIMARRAGLDGEILFDALSEGSANSFALQNHGKKALLPGDFPTQAFSTRYAMKDLLYALQLAEDTNVATPGASTVFNVFKQSIDAGDGDNYWPVIMNIIDRDMK